MSKEHGTLKSKFKITKYDDEESYENGEIKEVSKFEKNLFLTEGITKLWNLIANIDATGYYSNANAHIGVGDGTTAAAVGQTALQGTNKAFASMDTGYPQVSGNEITFYATFDGTTGNFAWEEFCVVNAIDDTGALIDRKVESQGTKAPGAIWEFEITLSIN